ncbi:ABC transporter permease [Alkalihalobacterium chitinilyticum]|uniref:Iron ABC transporter permease n=1 Tax=Alkalihalobacterium chitinilyticum TaxID=2980103 RepID=A0ABT5VEW1_9BACI|nr:iron ABC transporter permease [Alkalihalobacterium chitinilyticum]MDE5413996.1 iron ABC transporter permease [Alkalihalobacterium chitinilyticum]
MSNPLQGRRESLSSFFSLPTKLTNRMWIGLTLFLIFLLFVWPIVRLALLSFSVEEGHVFSNYFLIFQEARTLRVLSNTFIIVFGSTILSLFLGVSLAWIVGYSDIRYKKIVSILVMLPFIIPSYIVTLSWTQFMGNNGMFAKVLSFLPGQLEPLNLYSYTGMIIILGLSHYPLVFLLTMSIIKRIPRELEWAVRSSGGSYWTSFRKVTLPLALPGIASGGLLAFLANLDNFGIPAFLGIPANITVLSTAIYQEIVGFGPNAFARAATFSVILGIIALLGTLFQWLLLKRGTQGDTSEIDSSPRFALGRYRTAVEVSLWSFLIFISIVPLFSMVGSSLIRAYGLPFALENLTFNHYQFVLIENAKIKGAIVNSLKLAVGTAFICLIAGTAIAYYRLRKKNSFGKWMEVSVGLPYALPGTVLALAMILTWMQPIPGWNPGIYGSIWILFIAYVTRFMILQVRGSMTAMSQIAPSMEEAAHVSGASGFSKWRFIMLPLLLPGLLSGAFLVLLTALTELTVSALLWSSGSETIGLMIFNFEQAGYTTYSTAFSTVIVITMLGLALVLLGCQKFYEKKVKSV